MSAVIYFVADLYPWWGLPLAFIFAEMANYHRRHGARPKMVICLLTSGFFLLLAAIYFWFNGMEKLRPAMQHVERLLFN